MEQDFEAKSRGHPPLSCHGCALEDGDDCARLGLHLPSSSVTCGNCVRNPALKAFNLVDRFVSERQAAVEMAEAGGE